MRTSNQTLTLKFRSLSIKLTGKNLAFYFFIIIALIFVPFMSIFTSIDIGKLNPTSHTVSNQPIQQITIINYYIIKRSN